MAVIEARDLTKKYGEFTAVDGISFEVAPGEWDAVEAIVRQRMGDAAELSVPLDVQIGRGANWDVAGH